MAKESTFPADDVPDRSDQVLAVLHKHHPVPVPATTLYLSVLDKRALAGEFNRLEEEGRMVRGVVRPGEPGYEEVRALSEAGGRTAPGAIGVYRLPD